MTELNGWEKEQWLASLMHGRNMREKGVMLIRKGCIEKDMKFLAVL